MNHYDLYISEYLSRNKTVSFEKIGHLSYFDKAQPDGQAVATGSLRFTFDKRAETSPELIDYIAERTGKNKTLIDSDIESMFELMRQIINIGNPHEIDGVGVFKMAKTGEIEFSIPDPTARKEELKSIKRQQSLSGTSFHPPKKNSKSALVFLAVIIVFGVVGVIGWGTFKLFINNKSLFKNTDTVEQVNILPHIDSTQKQKATPPAQQPAVMKPASDSTDFKFIHEYTASPVRAEKRTAQLIGFGNPAGYDSLQTDSGKIYRLYLLSKILPADTTRVKDSLQKYLQKPIKIERSH